MLKLTDLKELHSDAGEHELEQRRNDHDVPDGPDGHKHTLDHVLLRPKGANVQTQNLPLLPSFIIFTTLSPSFLFLSLFDPP